MSEPKLTWRERINALSINPDMADRLDIALMAAELSISYKFLDDLLASNMIKRNKKAHKLLKYIIDTAGILAKESEAGK